MHGVIILGGKGTRLNLFSRRVNNKALAMVYDRLVFEYPLNTLVRAGIKKITIVAGYRYAGDLMNVIGDGKEFGIEELSYVYQKEADGISSAIHKAKNTVHPDENVAVILGDNFFSTDITEFVETFERMKEQDSNKQMIGCSLFLKDVPDPERFGVAEVDGNQIVTNIVEKPTNPLSNRAVTGLYLYDSSVWERIENLKPSARGELEVTGLNMGYVKDGRCDAIDLGDDYWDDLGTPDSILDSANWIRDNKFELNYKIDAWK